jgi:hypothetical protein
LSQLPPDLAAQLPKKQKGETFAYAAKGAGGATYFVIRFGGITRPTLEQARPQLEAQTVQQAAAAGQKYLKGVAGELGVDVNPRYGTWKQDQLAITDFVNPVIKPTPAPSPSPVLPGQGGDGTSGGDAGTGGQGANPQPTPTG